MTSAISSLASKLLGGLGGGGSASSTAASGSSASGGASNMFGSILNMGKQLFPTFLAGIPILGAFAPFVSQLMPMLGSVTDSLKGASQTKADTNSASSGTIDSATAAGLLQMLAKKQAASGGADPLAPTPPALHLTGTAAQVATVQAALNAISQQAQGAQLYTALAGRDIKVTILDDAAYAKATQSGTPTAGNSSILLSSSQAANPQLLTSALVTGLSVNAQQPATMSPAA